jgi:hypothetical protein
MSMLSLNAYVLPLAVARLQGHGRTQADGNRELQLQLDGDSELHVSARRDRGGWVASATLRQPGEICAGECSQPTTTAIQAEAVALSKVAERSRHGASLAYRLRRAQVERMAAARLDGGP